jgi:(2Fe-2S) ferredoxin
MSTAAYRVHLCFGPTCAQFNPKELLGALEDEVRAQGLEERVSIQLSACRQRCEQSPSLNVYPGPIFYNRLTPDAVRRIVREHLTGGEPVAEYLFRPGRKPTTPPRPAVAGKRRWWN